MTRLLAWCCGLLLAFAAWPAHALIVLSYHDIRDDVAAKGDPDDFATSTRNFVAHLDWLRAHGYVPVSVQAVMDARAGGAALPDKAVLLTFDDGLRSVYTHVFPLLRAYRYPALVAPVTSWVEMPQGASIDYGPRRFTRDDFATWAQLREMRDSGLVEIGSHSNDLHRGVVGNRQGNQMPAAVTRIWSEATGYENDATYLARVRADLRASSEAIERGTGRKPRVMVWPYAAHNQPLQEIARDLGMRLSFDLEGRSSGPDLPLQGVESLQQDAAEPSLSRLLISDNPDIADLVGELRRDVARDGLRGMQVDLDYIYDPDPAQTERNLDQLVQRVSDIGPTHVFLQAFADPDGDGAAESLYFPNPHMPMRADLFNRVAWQLQTRAQVRVYAWMPVLGYDLPGSALRVAAPDPKDIPRLDPGNPDTLRIVSDLYASLAAHSAFQGILFHDDAYLRQDELPAFAGGDPAQRTRLLIEFTQHLQRAAERWRPKLVTVRNLFAQPVLEPESERWFAQRLDAFNRAYDYTALMAMPQLENASDPQAWMQRLVANVAAQPDGLRKTIFELQTVDWRNRQPIAPERQREQARRLIAAGVRHLAYYPDDPAKALPPLPAARETASARAFPYIER
jgi:biofilm PGA synthesis lipoprotein PgaB